jgi:hypothetical protein
LRPEFAVQICSTSIGGSRRVQLRRVYDCGGAAASDPGAGE